MARCAVCGRWAGFFKKFHDECALSNEHAMLLPQPKPTPPGEVAAAGFALGADFKRPQVTIRVNRPHRMIQIAQLHAVLMAALTRAGIDDTGHQASANIAGKLLQAVADGSTEHEFLTWCRRSESGVSGLDSEWHRLFFWAGRALDAAETQAIQMWDEAVEEVFPYFELWADACPIPGHTALNNFVAARRDPIWQYLWPPNDWLCGCTVVSLMQCEGDMRADANVPGCGRVDDKLMNRALSWYQRSPRAAMKAVGTK